MFIPPDFSLPDLLEMQSLSNQWFYLLLLGVPGAVEEDAVVDSPMDEFATAAEPTKPTLDIRTYFPETWLWDLHLVG